MKKILKILRKNWSLCCMTILIVIIGGYIASGSDIVLKLGQQRIATTEDQNEGLSLQEAAYSHETDEIKWNIDAMKIQFSQDQQHINFTDFLLTISPKNRSPFRVSGERAYYNRVDGTIHMSGNIMGKSDDGYQLETDRASVNEQTKEIKSDAFVKITGPFFTVTGNGFEGQLTQQQFRVLSKTNTNIYKEVL